MAMMRQGVGGIFFPDTDAEKKPPEVLGDPPTPPPTLLENTLFSILAPNFKYMAPKFKYMVTRGHVSGILDVGGQENNSTESWRFVYGGTSTLT